MAQFSEVGVELVVKGAGDFFGTLNKAGGKIAGFGKSVGKVAVAGMAAFGAAATGVAAASIGAAVSFESAWAGVIKTTDGLVDEMGNLTTAGEEVQQGFRNLAKEVPTSVEELLAIGELGGQLGIAQEGLIDFTRTIAAMGEATNLTTEEAATGFAQLANIMGTPQDQIENMGSSVVALGNNFATTERDILTFAQRIAGAGEIAGLTESQVFAIGAAMSSVGVQAEAGGTAVQKVLLAMNQSVIEGGEQLDIFAATAGFSAEDFAAAWERDAGLAFQDFVEGLGASGDDALAILSELGLEDQRLIRSFLSLANAGDLLGETLDTSGRAFRENTALTKEAAQRYATTESQFKIFKNVIKDVGITIGSALLPFINKLLTAAKPLIEELGKKLPDFLNNVLIPAIEKVAAWLGEMLPIAIQFLSDFWTNTLQPALTAFWQFTISTLIPLLSQLFTWLATNIPLALQTLSEFWTGTLQPAIETVVGFIKENLEPILVGIATVIMAVIIPAFIAWAAGAVAAAAATIVALAPILVPLAAIGAAAALIYKAWTENWGGIRDVVLPIVTAIVDFVTEKIGAVVAFVQENWPLIQEAIATVIGVIQTIIQTALTAIQDFWTAHGATIMDFIRDLWNIIKSIINTATEAVKGTIQAILLAISGNWEDAWTKIKDTAQNLWDAFVRFMKDAGPKLWEVVRGIVKQIPIIILSIGSKLLEAGGKIIGKLKEGLSSAWGALESWFKSKLEGLTSWLPFSEPKKGAASPLYGLSRAGEAIVKNITAGMAAAVGQLDTAQTRLAFAARQTATRAATVPAMAAVGANISMTNQFNTSINGGVSQAVFETQVQRVVERAIGQAA